MPGTVMKRRKIIAALLSLVILAFLPSAQACAAVKYYKDEEHGFSFSYPETWQLHSLLFEGMIVLAPQADAITAHFFVNTLSPYDEAKMTKEDMLNNYVEASDKKVKVLSYGPAKLGGVPCVAIEVIYASGKKQIRERMYRANHEGKGYVIAIVAISKKYGEYEDSFKMMLDSFRF